MFSVRFPNLAAGLPNLAAAFSECGLFLILNFLFFARAESGDEGSRV